MNSSLSKAMSAFTDSGSEPGMTDFGFYRFRNEFGMTDVCLQPALRQAQGPSCWDLRSIFISLDARFYRSRNEFGMTEYRVSNSSLVMGVFWS